MPARAVSVCGGGLGSECEFPAGEAEVAWACGRGCEGLIRELEGERWVGGGL